jgi:DUF4097 and DUF4098 domain-containing protein YvlB
MERTFETPRHLTLEVRVPSGSIQVRAEPRTTTRLRTSGERDPEDFRVAFDDGGDGHRLVVEYRGKRVRFLSLGEDIEVSVDVPEGTDVSCETGSADIEVSGPVGALSAKTGSGDVRFGEALGDVALKSGSGDLKGTRVGGDLAAHTASGDVGVGTVAGGVVARTASGDLSLGEVDGSVQAASVSGDVEIRSLLSGTVRLNSVSGDVDVGVAAGVDVYLDLGATSGDVSSDLEGADAPVEGPQLELTATTVSGDIRVRRGPSRSKTSE